ncbi:hypothetical protein TNCV_3189431 [Trichonephila clavipes]|nr:hypothetical protein TNCV_3189431 [Trichonephila clavipes]
MFADNMVSNGSACCYPLVAGVACSEKEDEGGYYSTSKNEKDIVPLDYHLFSAFKVAFSGHNFKNNAEVLQAVRQFLALQSTRVSSNVVYKLGGEVENILRSHNYIEKQGRKRNPKEEMKRRKDASPEVFQIAAIDMYGHRTQTRHRFVDMFENTECFTDRNSRDGYSCHLRSNFNIFQFK